MGFAPRESKMKLHNFATIMIAATTAGPAFAAHLPPGTEVPLVFRQSLSNKHAYVGETVMMAVKRDVYGPNGRLELRAGTPVTGVIEKVNGRSHFGVNARIRIAINPVHGIYLEPRDKGSQIGGTRTDEAAAASGGAALVFGPLGLAAGYFVVGHNVTIHPGDTLRTVVSG